MSTNRNEISLRREFIAERVFLADTATVVGNVFIGKDASVWFGAVIRGDTDDIRIGEKSNVQDNAVLHADANFPCVVGDRVTIGHSAIVHGALVEDDVLIGMGAIVLNGATIERGSVIAPGSVITEGQVISSQSVVMGVPGKVRRAADDADFERIQHASHHYVELAKNYAHRNQL